MKTVIVFGVFDRFHTGHRALLRQAKKYGRRLIVVVARDSSVWKLKKKKPSQGERIRMRMMRKAPSVTKVVLGDKIQSSYTVVKKYKPDVVCLGYDQTWLAKDLRRLIRAGKMPQIKIIKLKAYKPRKFHTSFL